MISKRLTKTDRSKVKAFLSRSTPLQPDAVSSILDDIVLMIDEDMSAACESLDTTSPPIDRLFDVIMARIEAMQPWRQRFIEITRLIRRTPDLSLHMYRLQRDTQPRLWHLANLPTPTTIQTHAMIAIYTLTHARWEQDETKDLGQTMAFLNAALQRMDRWNNFA